MALPRIPHAWRLADLMDGICPCVVPAVQTAIWPGSRSGALGERQISALALDTRAVVPGALYLACGAARAPANAARAAARGAVAILADPAAAWPALAAIQARTGVPVLAVPGLLGLAGAIADRFYGEPSAGVEVFGVAAAERETGLPGLLAQALGGDLRCAVLGTEGHGFPGELARAPRQPADAAVLQAALAGLRRCGAGAFVLELSPRTLKPQAADGVRFTHAVSAPAGRVCAPGAREAGPHSAAGGFREQRLLRTPGLQWAVLDLDAPDRERLLADLAPEVRVAGYSLQARTRPPARCDLWVRAAAPHTRPAGLEIPVQTDFGQGLLRAPIIGARHGADLVAVLAVLLTRGTPLEEALPALERVRAAPGRMEPFGGDGAPLVVVDDARTPDALERALTQLRRHGCRRLIAVFGCGGQRDRGHRPLMGAIAERQSDALILTDDNPGTESGDAIVAQILAGVARPAAVRVERRRGLAIRRAICVAGRGDAVLVAGKGRETTQDLGELTVHFSDRAQVVEALREWREGHH